MSVLNRKKKKKRTIGGKGQKQEETVARK